MAGGLSLNGHMPATSAGLPEEGIKLKNPELRLDSQAQGLIRVEALSTARQLAYNRVLAHQYLDKHSFRDNVGQKLLRHSHLLPKWDMWRKIHLQNSFRVR